MFYHRNNNVVITEISHRYFCHHIAQVQRDCQTERSEATTATAREQAVQRWASKIRLRLRSKPKPIQFQKKLKRRKSYMWLATVDQSLRNGTMFEGLQDFHYPLLKRPHDPYDWNLLISLADMGSDGVCPANWGKYEADLNWESRWGPSHRSWRCQMFALRYSQLWTRQVLFMIIWNSDGGSWHDDERYYSHKDVVMDNFENFNERSDQVFHWVSQWLIEDKPHLQAEACNPDIQAIVYKDGLKASSLWTAKPPHVTTNRFFGAFKRGKTEIQEWSCRLYATVSYMLETDTLPNGAKQLNLKLVKPDPALRSTAKQTDAARTIKQSMKSVSELAYRMYSDRENRYVLIIIVVYGNVIHRWFSNHNVTARSGPETRLWLLGQCQGGYMQHLREIAMNLRSCFLARKAGLDLNRISDVVASGDFSENSPCVAQHDELATHIGNYTLGMLGSRLRMGVNYIMGWPTRTVLFTDATAEKKAEAANEFKRSRDLFLEMKDVAEVQPIVDGMVKRPEHNHVTNVQLRLMLEIDEFRVSERFVQHCSDRNETVFSDQLVEDGIGWAKAACTRVRNKRLKSQAIWQAPVRGHVLDSLHRWTPPPLDEVGACRAVSMPEEVFTLQPEQTWEKLAEIKGYDVPSYHSPGPERINEHLNDSIVFTVTRRKNDFNKLQNAWMNCLFSGGQILVRDATGDVANGVWSFPLLQAGRLAWWSWPAEQLDVGLPTEHFLPSLPADCAKPDMTNYTVFIRDLGSWRAFEYTW